MSIDDAGVRVRHTGPLKLGGGIQLSFAAAGEVFVAASRLYPDALASGSGAYAGGLHILRRLRGAG